MEDFNVKNNWEDEYPKCVNCGAVFHLNCLRSHNKENKSLDNGTKCCPNCYFAAPLAFWIRLGKNQIN